ncbi:TetR/AcrR family transcriptional regulator [Streptomyces sp. NPDC057702]|uniref:TetR/AcrR family transcriptional regulator n=1 Tax=unclassified Streptomyces TaxID=2593676 RepID=UPI0036BAC284
MGDGEATGAPARRALTPGARRVLDAAAELFYGQGINAVGVDLIAQRAGVTKKTLYDRFGSKDALVAAYLRERDERWRGWLTARVEEAGRSAGEAAGTARVVATFDALEVWTRRENPRGCAFVNAAAELPDPTHPGHLAVIEQKRWLRDYLRALCRATPAADPERLADELVLLYEGAMVLGGLAVVDEPVRLARELAVRALAQRGLTAT